ncbi:carbohydrate kinase [Granulicella sp. WH15]|uniref:rhamnulokinase n=1 Tax=Granulicella sp. WH15 TaxID=2602070 RepID=UPI00136727F4|nr:FGGY-family carbohydrate kinase [Granulicella sp. WH15]QHN03312.1 carbohydrate kinase [Granulicella sp. WH15]
MIPRTTEDNLTPHDLRALVAIDLGAESCRVSLLRWLPEGPEIRLVYRFANEAVPTNGELHWQMSRILTELHSGLRLCAELAPEGIRSIAVDGWAVDYVKLDDNGNAVGEPFSYRDTRTLSAETAMHERISATQMREITGIQISRINTAYQLFADKLAAPELACKHWLNLPEYVLFRLGGRPVSELTNATHTQMVGLDGEWSPEIFEALELEIRCAPSIVPPGTDIGHLRGELAELPAFADTRLIAPCCHDTASAIAAIPDAGKDWAYISSGTWSLVGTLLDAPVNTPESSEANYTNLAGADGRTCFHRNVNGLWLLRQCMEDWTKAGATFTIAELVHAAGQVPTPHHLIDVDDPDLLLQGGMADRINAQLARRHLAQYSTAHEDAPHLASLIFHSLAARYADVLKHIEHMTSKHFEHLYIVGGGSQNALLTRLTSEATGLPIRGTETESSTLGNFAVQLATLERPEASSELTTSLWAKRLRSASRVV